MEDHFLLEKNCQNEASTRPGNFKNCIFISYRQIIELTHVCSNSFWLYCHWIMFTGIMHFRQCTPNPLHDDEIYWGKLIILTTSWLLARERTIPTERRPLVGANFCGLGVSRSQDGGSPTAVILVSRPEPPLFLPNTSSIVLTRLSGPRCRPTTSQKIW
jgi:hypothetical protein